MIACSAEDVDVEEGSNSPSSARQQQQQQQQQQRRRGRSSSSQSRDRHHHQQQHSSNCSWWSWMMMMRASSPSSAAAALSLYPSCGEEVNVGDASTAVSTVTAVVAGAGVPASAATLETKEEELPSSPTLSFQACLTTTAFDLNNVNPIMVSASHTTDDDETNDENAVINDNNNDDDDNDHDDILRRSLAALLHESIDHVVPSLWEGHVLDSTCVTEIRHVAQSETWDCGVACMQMILDWLRNNGGSTLVCEELISERQWMLQTVGTTSIWTIDLVCLLEQMLLLLSSSTRRLQKRLHRDDDDIRPDVARPASYLFLSKTLGVNNAHSGIRYYQRAFLKDQRRVEDLFRRARQRALPILQYPHLPMEIVIDLVSRPKCIAMVLVDNTLLQGKNSSNFYRSEKHENDTYQGHYVLLCGISKDVIHLQEAAAVVGSQVAVPNGRHHVPLLDDPPLEDDYCLALKNPACSDPQMMFVTPQVFERAWRATGTDDDIVFIVKHEKS